jgi:uncharacterized membrane protein YbhN (UPF0104 family)
MHGVPGPASLRQPRSLGPDRLPWLTNVKPTTRPAADEPAPEPRGSQRPARFDPRVWQRPGVRVFSSAGDAPRVRRPTDLVLLVLSFVGIVVFSLVAPGPTAIDQAIAHLVSLLPGLVGWFWEVSYDLLIGWALLLMVGPLVARGHRRLLLDQLLAALLSVGFAALAGLIGGTSWSSMVDALFGADPPAVYPAMRLAVATAVVATTSPHIAHPLRYIGRWVIAVGTVAAIALGIALPLGILTGYAVGFAAAAVTHLLLGSPGGRLSLQQVAAALGDLGVVATDLRHAPVQPRGVALATASAVDGRPLLVKLYGRDAWDSQLIASTWAHLWYRDETRFSGVGRLQQVEHEAMVALLAERAGVPVQPVVAAGTTDQGDALLVVEASGRVLATLDAGQVDDALLQRLWGVLGRLHTLGIALGRLNADGIVVRPDGSPAFSDLGQATVAAGDAGLMADRAQLLVATALLAGEQRAVAAAAASIGSEGLAETLPFLQPAVLDHATRRMVHAGDWEVDDLRKLAAETAGVDPPKLEQIRRVTWGSVVIIAFLGIAGYAVISAIAGVGLQNLVDELEDADAAWLWGALLLSPIVQVGQAFSTVGAAYRPVRLGPTLLFQYAIQFFALAVPSSAARVALEIRYFERVGATATGAVAIGVIDSVCGFVVQVLLILGITLSGLGALNLSPEGSAPSFNGKLLIVALVLLGLAVIVAVAVPRIRAMVRGRVADLGVALLVLRSPTKVALIFLGNLASQVLLAVILGFCLEAFGHHAKLADLILVNTFVSLFAGFMPVPGGIGVAEAGYTAGLAALGIPNAAALSTTLAFRMVTFYLPPIWGAPAMRWLRTHSYL